MTGSSKHYSRENWHELQSSAVAPLNREFRVLDTKLRNRQGAVLLALDALGLRHVLVPVANDFSPIHDRRSGGVHLTTRSLVDDTGQRHFLDLACQKSHLNDVFGYLADEVLEAIEQDPENAVQACRQTLQRWRELLDRDPSALLSTEALCGLFGELWHMSEIAKLNPLGIFAWQGPHRARHDFTAAGLALEIKTTLSRDEWKFRIHGLKQLDNSVGSVLYLCAMRLELNGASGVIVPDLIQSVLQSGVDRHELLSRLSACGYELRDEPHYRQFRIDVLDFRTYEVATPFPRLIDSTFGPPGAPASVSDVHYTIDLAAYPVSPCTQDVLRRTHAVLAGVHNVGASGSSV
jgi:hypothetical protein